MKTVTTLLLSVVLVVGGFMAGAWVQRDAAKGSAAGARKVLYYVDPMHPAYKSDRPGIAPDCGMQLEPVYADGGPAAAGESGAPRPAGAVAIAPEKQELLGVRVSAVEKTTTAQTVRLFGRVVPQETRVYVLNSAMEGSIRNMSNVTTGSRVRKDQWLASFFAADSRGALQAFITALDVADRDPVARQEAGVVVAAGSTASSSAMFTVERLRGLGMSSFQIDKIRHTRQIPLNIDIHAPADGVVLARNVSPGQKFERGAEWFRIANLDKVWVVADVFENEAPFVRPGMSARVVVPNQGRTVPARVAEVLPQFDPATRTLKVRLEVDNPGYQLLPDMFVDVELPVELPATLSIPVDAIIDSGARKTVFLERAPGDFEPRAIETGWRFGDRVEVVRGLAPGDRIVAAGTFLVDSESRLRSAAAGVHGAPAKDPVCGMDVDEAKARAAGKTLHRHGKDWFFCSDACRSNFEKSPEKYEAAAAATPGPAKSAL
jgi:membrane fusion protein, copper/silver efflux system